jgi:uncharacterized membrane protein YraQ (UPF0718 family)
VQAVQVLKLSQQVTEMFNEFKVIFLSIVIEAVPFLVIGSIIASTIELFVSEETIRKILPKKPIFQMIAAAFLGLIFPICECGVIPIVRGLIRKSVPVSTAIVFMLAAPIINPIPTLTTYYAFGANPEMMIHRIVLAFMIALTVGMMHKSYTAEDVLHESDLATEEKKSANAAQIPKSLFGKISLVTIQAWKDFLSVSSYIVISAALAAIMTVTLPGNLILYMQNNNIAGIAFLQALGYTLSLCSHADAFVGAGLAAKFTFYPVLAFLLIGPMANLKNSVALMGMFKKKFAITLILKIFAVVFCFVYFFRSCSF